MSSIQTRVATLDDIDTCLSFQAQTNENYWTREEFENIIQTDLAFMIVAEDEGKIIGYCNGYIYPTKQNEGTLHETRVDLNRRHEGIGTILVEKFCELLYEKGCERVFGYIVDEHVEFYVNACGFEISDDQWIEVVRPRPG